MAFRALLLVLLPHVWLYSLPHCTIDFYDPQKVYCSCVKRARIPSDIPKTAVSLSLSRYDLQTVGKRNFSGFNKLQRLSLKQNNISHIEDAAFSHLSGLKKLFLGVNALTNLTHGMFQGLSELILLDLQTNQISHLPPSVFAPLKKLQKLDLTSNLLSSLRETVNAVSFCPLLKTLDLTQNHFSSFESENVPLPLNVKELSWSANPLRSFALHSDVVPRLQKLDLSSHVSDLQWNVSDKAFLKSLKILNLSGSKYRKETYHLIFQSVPSVETLLLKGVGLDKGLLDFACGIQSLQSLDLQKNSMSAVNDSLLESCSQLIELDLSQNDLTDLSPAALQTLTRLSTLYIHFNRLSRVPLTIRNMSSLRVLSLKYNRIQKLQCVDFSDLRLLKDLDLSENKLSELNSCVFQGLQSLERLDIGGNFIELFDDTFGTSLPNLRVLDASWNKIKWIQKGAFKNMSRLTDLHLDSARATFVVQGAFDDLTNLRILSYFLYSPTAISTDTLVGPNFTSRGRSLQQQMFNLPSLQTLQITASRCFYLDPGYLKGLDNLKVLLSENSFCVFRDLDTLTYTPHLLDLQINKNMFWRPDAALFHPTPALQTMDLSENHLKSLDFLLEANLTQLQKLVLNNNELSVINVKVFEALPSLQYLDLLENPFACNCSNADFIHWAIFNRQVYVKRAFQYRCASPPSHLGLPLLDFNFRWCWEYPGFLCFVSSSALVLLTLLCTFIHHFLRFQLLYSFYLLRALLYHRQKQRQGCAQVYDAFVSYNVHDEEWVHRELVPELEERQGWRLCLHHRDFQPGKAILENITDAIYSSRKTLCVISRHYLHSEWCSREIQMASFRLLDEKKDVLVLLFLEEVSSKQLSPFFRMRKLLRSRTYVSWSGARGHRGLFWEQVRRALQSGADLPAEGLLPPDV